MGNKKQDRFNNHAQIKEANSKRSVFREKVFLHRNSVLTDMYENNQTCAVYNFFVMIMIMVLINSSARDYLQTGRFDFGLTFVNTAFKKLPTALVIWVFMLLSVLVIHPFLSVWGEIRMKFIGSKQKKLWDYFWIMLFIVYLIQFIYLPVMAILKFDIGGASSFALLLEQSRMLMKSYALVRESARRANTDKEDKSKVNIEFEKYVYYLFAPTLIYRDEYPRTDSIKWKYVLACFTELLFIISFMGLLIEKFFYTPFHDYGIIKKPLSFIILTYCDLMLPTFLLLWLLSHAVFHSWQNAWAEMLRFGDRLFYKDWWTSKSYQEYFQRFSTPVHEWLYTYLYRDIYYLLGLKGKTLATVLLFLVSAIFHELILNVAMRTTCPINFIFFMGIGVPMNSVKSSVSNLLVLVGLSSVGGFIVGTYMLEHFARQNCPPAYDSIWDVIIPRLFTCDAIE